ncbi:hypothetical protein KM043_018346 [Ampulex compressa]|nr:hypothetical protein KM043_018346 [Ampulex compressa]
MVDERRFEDGRSRGFLFVGGQGTLSISTGHTRDLSFSTDSRRQEERGSWYVSQGPVDGIRFSIYVTPRKNFKSLFKFLFSRLQFSIHQTTVSQPYENPEPVSEESLSTPSAIPPVILSLL